MKINVIATEGLNQTIEVVVEKADYTEKVEKEIKNYQKKATLPGFRPGKVPYGVLYKMMGKAYTADTVMHFLNEKIYEHLFTNKINILFRPLLNENPDGYDFSQENDFVFTFSVGLKPDFEVDMTHLNDQKLYVFNLSDEEYEAESKNLRSYFSQIKTFEEVNAESMVSLHISTNPIVESTEPIAEKKTEEETGDGETESKKEEHASNSFINMVQFSTDEMREMFLGKKIGDILTWKAGIVRDKDNKAINLFGTIEGLEDIDAEAPVYCKIVRISGFQLPEPNQEFFNQVFGENKITSEEDYRKQLTNKKLKDYLDLPKNYLIRKLLEEISSKTEFSLPDAFLSKYYTHEISKEVKQENTEKGFSLFIDSIKRELILDRILKGNEINISYETIEETIKNNVKAYLEYESKGQEISQKQIDDYYAKLMDKNPKIFENTQSTLETNRLIEVLREKHNLKEEEITFEDFYKIIQENQHEEVIENEKTEEKQ